MPGKHWTEAEEDYLYEYWGRVNELDILKTLKEKFGRELTQEGLEIKAYRLGIGSAKANGSWLTTGLIKKILGADTKCIYRWILSKGLKAKRKKLLKRDMWLIDPDDFMSWLKNNQTLWNSNKMELYALGIEPDWLKQKRKNDAAKKTQPLSIEQKERALTLMGQGYTYKQIGAKFGKSQYAIRSAVRRYIQSKQTKKGA